AAILGGRETVITARAPREWRTANGGRMWRIKAGLKISEYVLYDESPYFVGWGTGDPEEVPKLEKALTAAARTDERIAAAGDLAKLGPAARRSLPVLRRALGAADARVALAAAKA